MAASPVAITALVSTGDEGLAGGLRGHEDRDLPFGGKSRVPRLMQDGDPDLVAEARPETS